MCFFYHHPILVSKDLALCERIFVVPRKTIEGLGKKARFETNVSSVDKKFAVETVVEVLPQHIQMEERFLKLTRSDLNQHLPHFATSVRAVSSRSNMIL